MTQQTHGRGAGRNKLELCLELVNQAMKCLSNEDRECVVRLIEELVRANCHNGYVVGKEIAGKVKEIVHDLWLVSDNECRCELLSMLRSLGMSKNWIREMLKLNSKGLNKWLTGCRIDWEGKATRNDVVRQLEDFLRERFGWDEIKMCESVWKFVGVDIEVFRKYGVEPCIWLKGLKELSDLRNPYWLGLAMSDLTVRKGRNDNEIELSLFTTNSIDAIFFPVLLSMIKIPSLVIEWGSARLKVKYVHKPIRLGYYIHLGPNAWPWPIELSAGELERILDGFSDEELAMFMAGLIDGDGSVQYNYKKDAAYVLIVACKNCPKRAILDVLKEVIAKRFGIVGTINQHETADVLVLRGEKAVKLLRRIVKYIHHPIRRIRAELILALHDGRISPEEFERFYEQTEYERGRDDIKRNRGLETLTRAAPQTHTHGESRITKATSWQVYTANRQA